MSADGPAVRPYQQSDRTARRSVPTNNQTGRPGGPSLPTIRPDGPAVRPYQQSDRTARRSVPTCRIVAFCHPRNIKTANLQLDSPIFFAPDFAKCNQLFRACFLPVATYVRKNPAANVYQARSEEHTS